MDNNPNPQFQSDGPSPMDELQTLLAEQVSLAKSGKLEEVSSLSERVDEILALASVRSGDSEQCECIRRLHNELCLTLTAQKGELSGQLRKMQMGKNSLHAYRDASSAR